MSIVLLLLFALLVYYIVQNSEKILKLALLLQRSRELLKNIPGPPALPIIGCAHLFKIDTEAFTYQCEEWGRKYLYAMRDQGNGLLLVWIGPIPLVFCGTHEAIRPILESTVHISKPNQYDIVSSWIGNGLLTSTHQKWFQRRKMLTPAFHFNILQRYHHVFSKHGRILVDQLDKHAAASTYFDIFLYIKRCALDIICETAMGTKMNAQIGLNNEYVNAVTRISAIIWSYQRFPWLWLAPVWFPWLWLAPVWYGSGIGFEFDRLVNLTNDFTRKVIAQRKATMQQHFNVSELNEDEIKSKKLAFLDLLLNMQKSNELTDEDIREEVDTFMFEGHDTTASGIGFCLWWLGQEPRCLRLVQEELDAIFEDSNRDPTADDVKQMVHLEKCIKEALRYFPSVPLIARRLERDVRIGKHILPEGLSVVVSPFASHRDPQQYEKPDEFYPEHFDANVAAKRDPYAYVPFSAGPRNCIGQKFAILEEKIILSWILRKYEIRTRDPWPQNRPVPELILKPSRGFQVRLYPREHN